MEALSRSGRSHWGIDSKWAGNYMNISSENLDTEGYRTALSKEGVAPTKVVFSAKVNKFNRHGKVSDNTLLLSKLLKSWLTVWMQPTNDALKKLMY